MNATFPIKKPNFSMFCREIRLFSSFWAIIVDTAPAHSGTYSGIMHFIANIATILAPTLTGEIRGS